MTPVEWLAKELYEKFEMIGSGILFDEILEKAKEMEKENIINAYRAGRYEESPFIDSDEGEMYYNKIYNQNQ